VAAISRLTAFVPLIKAWRDSIIARAEGGCQDSELSY
jgi:hypothetical protein